MSQKKLYFAGAVLLLIFGAFAVFSLSKSATPYVSFEQARSMDRGVQVAGSLEPGSSAYDDVSQALYFTLVEETTGETLRVAYEGVKPANFEEAVSIVALGKYSPDQDLVHANQLLVKCPSKYQGAEMEEKSYG